MVRLLFPQGKGNMLTYWLTGKGMTTGDDAADMADAEDVELPGEITYGSKDASKIIIIKPDSVTRGVDKEQIKSLQQMAEHQEADGTVLQPREGIHY